MIGKTIGNLKIVKELGKGGMGVVYLAEHMRLAKRFAVKSLSPELTQDPLFRQRFYQEAQNQSLLDHPNIVQATDFFEEYGQFFLVMEFVDGQSLSDLIEEKGHLAKEEAFPILKDILAGLGFAHSKGVIHRDIKPSNIMISQDGRARIMDFGIAILAGEKRLTGTGRNIGSPWYMSPEQISRPSEIDQRSDIYSLGVLMFEMLTGNVPFEGETEFAVQSQQLNTPPPNPIKLNPEINVEYSHIILRAMEKNPDKRFQSCQELLQAIKTCEDKQRAAAAPYPSPPKRLILAVLALIVIAAAVGTFYVTKRHEPTPVNSSKEVLRVQREATAGLIQGAVDQIPILCRELKNLGRKNEALRIAQESLPDPDLVEQYENQIADIKRNIHDGLIKYNGALEKLQEKQNAVGDDEFNAIFNALAKKNAGLEKTFRLVQTHYEHYAKRGQKVEEDTLSEFCSGQ